MEKPMNQSLISAGDKSSFSTGDLSPLQVNQLSSLVKACNLRDQIRLSYPLEENCVHFLSYDQDILTSCLCLFFPSEDLCECSAFTHPEYRKRGLFTALLTEASDYLERLEQHSGMNIECCFVTGGKTLRPCEDTWETLKALEAEYLYSEYMMDCPLNLYEAFPPDSPGLEIVKKEDGLNGFSCLFMDKHQVIGSCEYMKNGLKAYIHHVEISPAFRNQGYGTVFLQKLLWLLSSDGLKAAQLQVSSSNPAAMALYKKTGFQIYEILSYWLW